MGDATVKPSGGDDLVLSNDDGSAKIEVNEGGGIDITLGGGTTDDLNIDSNTLVVESDTNSVGIGTDDPAQQFHISGATPIIQLTDTDTGADSLITASNATGSLKIQCDNNNETGSSTFEVDIDGSQRMKVDSTGDMTITDGDLVIGTAGHGIDFSVNSHASGMTSELFDSYEEGTWTPVLADHASAGNTLSGTANGFYTRIGRSVFISGRFACSNLNGASGDLILRGLPFTVKNSTGCDSAFSIGYATGLSMNSGEAVVWNVQKGLTIAYAMDWSDSTSSGSGQGFFSCAQFTASGIFTWSGHYFI